MFRLLTLIILLFTSLLAQDTKKLKVVFPKNFPPSYVYVNNQPSGYGIELFKEIEKDLGLNVEYLPQESWKEVFVYINNGTADIIPNQGITEDRKKNMNFSKEVQSINIAIYSFKDKKILGVKSLENKKVGVIKSNVAYKILAKHVGIDLQVYEDQSHFFDDFIDGHIEYIAYTEPAILNFAKKYNVLEKIEKSFDLVIIHRGIAVNKKHPKLVEKINDSINKLKENGKLDQIYNKWHKEEKSYTQTEFFQVLILLGIFFLFLTGYLKYSKIILTGKELEEEVKKKTKLLKESKEQFEFAAERALNGYWEWNLNTHEIKCSNSWYEILGLNNEEFKPSIDSIKKLIHKDDQKSNENDVKRLINGLDLSYSHELRLKNADGKYLWFSTFGTVYENMNKERIFFGFLLNINDKKELEEKRKEQERLLLHQSKMAAMGEMLENIAHQWRQPLSMISTSATGVEFQKEMGILKDEYLIESLKNINESTQYLSTTIDDFRNYFSSNKFIQEFDLKEAIEKVLRLVSSKFKNSEIDIVINCENQKVYNLENELIQVIINILNNAKDALESKELIKKVIFINSYKVDDNLFIEIHDNAGGIKEDFLEKVFEPYFTTKHQSQGTGLGLFMCEEILHKHMGGSISVKNVEFEHKNKTYKGAKFIISIKNL